MTINRYIITRIDSGLQQFFGRGGQFFNDSKLSIHFAFFPELHAKNLRENGVTNLHVIKNPGADSEEVISLL